MTQLIKFFRQHLQRSAVFRIRSNLCNTNNVLLSLKDHSRILLKDCDCRRQSDHLNCRLFPWLTSLGWPVLLSRLSFHSILGHRILSVVLYGRASFCFLASNTLTHGMAALLRIVNGKWWQEMGKVDCSEIFSNRTDSFSPSLFQERGGGTPKWQYSIIMRQKNNIHLIKLSSIWPEQCLDGKQLGNFRSCWLGFRCWCCLGSSGYCWLLPLQVEACCTGVHLR